MVLQATIESGGTFTREYRVGGLFALGLKGTLQPYEIDIETKEQNAPDSAYTRIQPLQDFSTITISDTLAHTFQTNQVEEVVRLTVTNNSSGRMTLHGSPVDTIDEYFVQDGRRWLYAEKQDTNSVTIGSNQYDVAEDGSGDLVIRDDAGNDVLIWDQSAGQWDFKSQVVANLGELSTDSVTINDVLTANDLTLSDDPTSPTEWMSHVGTNMTTHIQAANTTVAGDNSAVTIFDILSVENGNLIIIGRKQGSSDTFIETVTVTNVRIGSTYNSDTRGAAVTPTYSRSGANLQAAINDSGSTYDIAVFALGGAQV